MRMRLVLPVLLLASVLIVRQRAQGAAYAIVKVADTSSLSPFNGVGVPSINNSRVVSFQATNKTTVQGIYTWSGGPLNPVLLGSGSFGFLAALAPINNTGTIAFGTANAINTGIYKISSGGGPTTTIIETSNLSGRAMNDGGTVTFGLPSGIFTGSGGALHTIADTSGPFSGFSGVEPDINGAGTVFFYGNLDSGESGVYKGNGGPITTIADSTGTFSLFNANALSMNDSGTAVFAAILDSGARGIYTGNGGPVTTFVDDSGPLASASYPVINASGKICFEASLDAGGQAIFTGPDPVADRLIGTGDSLFGSTVFSLAGVPLSMNDNGDIAFQYQLTSGVRGIAVALVPEPTAAALAAPAAALLMFCTGRRNQNQRRKLSAI